MHSSAQPVPRDRQGRRRRVEGERKKREREGERVTMEAPGRLNGECVCVCGIGFLRN